MRRPGLSLIVAGAALLGGLTTGEARASAITVGAMFVPLDPVRVLDTRVGTGVPAGKPGPGSVTTVTLADHGGVPATATAVVLNVTITEATAPGYVTVYPAGGVPGTTSNLNVERAGQTVPNLVVVKLGTAGAVSIYAQNGGHLIADLLGFFDPVASATAGRFVSLPAPVRLFDTRNPDTVPIVNPGDAVNCSSFATWAEANVWFWTYHRFGDPGKLDQNNDNIPCESLSGVPSSPRIPADLFKLGATGTRKIPVTVNASIPGGVVPAGASAVVLNVTATEATAAGYVQVIPTGGNTALGASSNLNVDKAGQTIPNLVVVPIGADGTVTFYSQTGTHLLADVAGYFTGPSAPDSTAGLFQPLDPQRLIDTRNMGTKPGASSITNVIAGGQMGVPANAAAVFINVTITEANGPGYVQVYPTGQGTPGNSSSLNVEAAGQTRPNAVFTGLGIGGQFTMYALVGGHLLADVAGWFSATPA